MRKKFSRNGWKAAGIGAVTAALLVPLLVFGGPAFARTSSAASEYEYSGASQYQYRVQICHRTHSAKHPYVLITVSSAAVPAHIRHGDAMPNATAPVCPTTLAFTKHGHGHGHGNGNGSGGDQNQNGATPGNGGGHGGHGGHGKP